MIAFSFSDISAAMVVNGKQNGAAEKKIYEGHMPDFGVYGP